MARGTHDYSKWLDEFNKPFERALEQQIGLTQKLDFARQQQKYNQEGLEALNSRYAGQQEMAPFMKALSPQMEQPMPQAGEGQMGTPSRQQMLAPQQQQQFSPQQQPPQQRPQQGPQFLNPAQLKAQYELYGAGPQGEQLALENNARGIAQLLDTGRVTKPQAKALVAQHIPNRAIADSMNQAIDAHFKPEEDVKTSTRKIEEGSAGKYYERMEDLRAGLGERQQSIELQRDAIKRGGIGPLSLPHIADIAEGFGAPAAVTAAFRNPESKEFTTATKDLFRSLLAKTFKGTTTAREINYVEGMLAQIGNPREAALASNLMFQMKVDLDEAEIELFDKFRDRGVDPSKIPSLVQNEMKPIKQAHINSYKDAIEILTGNKPK